MKLTTIVLATALAISGTYAFAAGGGGGGGSGGGAAGGAAGAGSSAGGTSSSGGGSSSTGTAPNPMTPGRGRWAGADPSMDRQLAP